MHENENKNSDFVFCRFTIRNFSTKSHDTPRMAQIISGNAIAKQIRTELKQHIEEWVAQGFRRPHLTAVLIGDDPASHTYVNNKIKVTQFHPENQNFLSFHCYNFKTICTQPQPQQNFSKQELLFRSLTGCRRCGHFQ